MTKTALLFLVLCSAILRAQNYCLPKRFIDQNYFATENLYWDTTGIYGEALDWKGNIKKLHFNIIYPKINVDSLKKRPFIMLIHGGAFHIGDRHLDNKYALILAKMGFVVASIDYRLGWNNPNGEADFDPAKKAGPQDSSGAYAAYRAHQDAHAALRYFVKNAGRFGIDTAWIFVGGHSAGATTSMNLVFGGQESWDKLAPYCPKKLGRITNSTNNISSAFTIKGVIEMWGYCTDTSFITKKKALSTPIVLFHGTKDSFFDVAHTAQQSPLQFTMFGSKAIAERYKQFGACYHFFPMPGGGHEGGTKEFITAQVGCFFKSLFCKECVSIEKDNLDNSVRCNYCAVDKR